MSAGTESWLNEEQWTRLYQRIRPSDFTLPQFKELVVQGKLGTLKRAAIDKVHKTLQSILEEEGRIKDAAAKIHGSKEHLAQELSRLICKPADLLDAATAAAALPGTSPPLPPLPTPSASRAQQVASSIHERMMAKRRRDAAQDDAEAVESAVPQSTIPMPAAAATHAVPAVTSSAAPRPTAPLAPPTEFPFASPMFPIERCIKRFNVACGTNSVTFEIPKDRREAVAQRRLRVLIVPVTATNAPVAWPKVKELYVFVNSTGITTPWRRQWPPHASDRDKAYLALDITFRVSLQTNYQQLTLDCFDKTYSATYAVVLARARSETEVVDEIVARATEAGALASLQHIIHVTEGDDDVVADRPVVSVKCPLSQTRMTIPVRGRQCEHLQCVDLLSFIRSGNTACYWVCPVCDKSMNATHDTIVVDVTLMAALEKTKDIERIKFVRLHGHDVGSFAWVPVSAAEIVALDESQSSATSTPQQPQTKRARDDPCRTGTAEDPICLD